jgi:hypothetical protein
LPKENFFSLNPLLTSPFVKGRVGERVKEAEGLAPFGKGGFGCLASITFRVV